MSEDKAICPKNVMLISQLKYRNINPYAKFAGAIEKCAWVNRDSVQVHKHILQTSCDFVHKLMEGWCRTSEPERNPYELERCKRRYHRWF